MRVDELKTICAKLEAYLSQPTVNINRDSKLMKDYIKSSLQGSNTLQLLFDCYHLHISQSDELYDLMIADVISELTVTTRYEKSLRLVRYLNIQDRPFKNRRTTSKFTPESISKPMPKSTTYSKAYQTYRRLFPSHTEFYKTDLAKKIAAHFAKKHIMDINQHFALFFFYALNQLFLYCVPENDADDEDYQAFEQSIDKHLLTAASFACRKISAIFNDTLAAYTDDCSHQFLYDTAIDFLYELLDKAYDDNGDLTNRISEENLHYVIFSLKPLICNTIIAPIGKNIAEAMRQKYGAFLTSRIAQESFPKKSVSKIVAATRRLSLFKDPLYATLNRETEANLYQDFMQQLQCKNPNIDLFEVFRKLDNRLKQSGNISERQYRKSRKLLGNHSQSIQDIDDYLKMIQNLHISPKELAELYTTFLDSVMQFQQAFKSENHQRLDWLCVSVYRQAYYLYQYAQSRHMDTDLHTEKICHGIIEVLCGYIDENADRQLWEVLQEQLAESVYNILTELYDTIQDHLNPYSLCAITLFQIIVQATLTRYLDETAIPNQLPAFQFSKFIEPTELSEICTYIHHCIKFIDSHLPYAVKQTPRQWKKLSDAACDCLLEHYELPKQ